MGRTRSLVAIAVVAVVVIATALSGQVMGVRSITNGQISPGSVDESTTVNHDVGFTATDINASGQSVIFYIRFPDVVNLNPNSASAEDGSGSSVSISSSIEVVDGPDMDTAVDTLRFGVQPDRGGAQIDIVGSVNVDITYPDVSSDTTYSVYGRVEDTNDGTTAGPSQIATVTVEDLDDTGTGTPTDTPDGTDTPTDTPDGTDTPTDTPDGDGEEGLARFDKNENNRIDFGEALEAVQAFNEGTQIGGQPVTFQEVLKVIGAFNENARV